MKTVNGKKTGLICDLILASASRFQFAHWEAELSEIANLAWTNDLSCLRNELTQLNPEILLLDSNLPGLDGLRSISELRRLSPRTKFVLLDDSSSDEDELNLFRAGVRGICPSGISQSTLHMMINAVRSGELWIRRSLTYRLLEHLKINTAGQQTSDDNVPGRLDSLTQREHEIAMRVGSGESNKYIAHSLEISERTVKAHLTNIFRKMGVTDRLKMAVMLSVDRH